jgi:hypothetical protein
MTLSRNRAGFGADDPSWCFQGETQTAPESGTSVGERVTVSHERKALLLFFNRSCALWLPPDIGWYKGTCRSQNRERPVCNIALIGLKQKAGAANVNPEAK